VSGFRPVARIVAITFRLFALSQHRRLDLAEREVGND
jgi:hypothetical protein